MTDEVANLVLEQLRQMRADSARIESKVDALGETVERVENAVSGLAYITASLMGELVDVKARLDRLEARP